MADLIRVKLDFGDQPPAEIRTPGPRTGVANPDCYAAPLNDCEGRLSLEHYWSASVLEVLGDTLQVTGLAWMKPGETKTIPVPVLGSNILCQRHNEALSPLDDAVGSLFRSLNAAAKMTGEDLSVVRLISGLDFERWLLKLLVGACVSGNLRPTGPTTNWRADLPILNILFENEGLPKGFGLFMHPRVASFTLLPPSVEMGILEEDGDVMGVRVNLHGLLFYLTLFAPNVETNAMLRGAVNRPERLVVRAGDQECIIDLSWPAGLSTAGARVEVKRNSQ
jgi:hypothetical protein